MDRRNLRDFQRDRPELDVWTRVAHRVLKHPCKLVRVRDNGLVPRFKLGQARSTMSCDTFASSVG